MYMAWFRLMVFNATFNNNSVISWQSVLLIIVVISSVYMYICIVYIITLSLNKMLHCYMYIESIFVLYVTLCLFGGP
jgi:hypothetical protein